MIRKPVANWLPIGPSGIPVVDCRAYRTEIFPLLARPKRFELLTPRFVDCWGSRSRVRKTGWRSSRSQRPIIMRPLGVAPTAAGETFMASLHTQPGYERNICDYDTWGSRPCKFCAFPGRNLRNLARPSISLATIVADAAEAAALYPCKLLLSRPDQHVAWRSDKLPADPTALIDRVRGASTSA